MRGYCWRAASPNHSSYSLHLTVAKITSLLPSSALPCPFPCTVNRRALALAMCLTAAVKCIWMNRIFCGRGKTDTRFGDCLQGMKGDCGVGGELEYLPQLLI